MQQQLLYTLLPQLRHPTKLFHVYIATVFPLILVTWLLWRRYGRLAVDLVDSVDFVDPTVDEVEVDFVANVYEALVCSIFTHLIFFE